jgi:hypothetical protein
MEHKAANLSQLRDAIQADFPDDRCILLTYPSSRWSNANPLEIATLCVTKIQSEFDQRNDEGYREVILVGHSLGALLVRKACLIAHGICSDFAPGLGVRAAPRRKAWANKITRLVLLAGMSRAWRLTPRNQHTPRVRWLARVIQLAVARAFGHGHLVRAAHRGTPFIVNLRLDWLGLVNGDYIGEIAPALVVQIAGLHDTMVHPSDHIDLQAGRNFKYLSVQATKHDAMVLFDEDVHGAERK